MIYNNRLYPYPVLGISDDVNGLMEVDLKIASDGKNIQVSPTFNLDNKKLEQLIKDNNAYYVVHVYCRGTMFRDVFSTKESIPSTFMIPAQKLNGETEVDFFICSDKEYKYTNDQFNNDYKGYEFNIERGDILAYAGKGKFYANKTFEDLTSVSALMNIDTSNQSNKPMFIEYDGEKITIMLCKEDYERYQNIKSQSWWINVLLSSVVFPVLVETLHFLDDEELSKEYMLRRWYIVLSELKYNSKEKNNLKIAQNILDLPNNRAFDSLIKIIED